MSKTSSRAMLLVSVILGIAALAWGGECYDYRETFQPPTTLDLPQAPTDLATDGSMALLLIGQEVHCYDFSTPSAPDLRGVLDLGVVPVEVVSDGQLAAILTDDSILMLDWTDPAAMQVTVTIPRPAGLESMDRHDGWLVLCLGVDGLAMYDCSDPGDLTLISSLDTPDQAVGSVMHGGFLLVADTSSILTVDVGDPGAPVVVSTYAEDSDPEQPVQFLAIDTDGTNALQTGNALLWFVYDDGHGDQYYQSYCRVTSVFDVSPLGELTRRHRWEISTDAASPLIRGGVVHTAETEYSLVSVTGDETFTRLSTTLASTASDLAAGEGFDLVSTVSGDVLVVDLTFPFLVQPAVTYNGPEFHGIGGGAVLNGWLLRSTRSWSGMYGEAEAYLYSISDPEQPSEVNRFYVALDLYNNDCSFTIVAADPVRAIVEVACDMGTGYQLCIPADTEGVNRLLPYHGKPSLFGDHVFQFTDGFDSPDGLGYFDISDPDNIVSLGFHPGSFSGTPFAVDETKVLVVSGGDIQLVDFSDPDAPVVRSVVDINGFKWLARDGDRVYFRSDIYRLSAIDVGDADNLRVIWDVPVEDRVLAMTTHCGLAVLVCLAETGYLQVADLSGEAGPVRVSEPFAAAAVLHAPCWQDEYLYTNTTEVYEMSDPADPVYLGRGTGSSSALYIDDGWLVTAAGLFPTQCGGVTAIDDITDPIPTVPESIRLLAAPNPFNPQTTVKFDLPWASQVELAVFDVRGRRVRTLVDGGMTAGGHAVNWDGRDDTGRGLASGVYLARLATDRRVTTARLVLVR